jgi:signal transduction histidine kinase
MNLSLKNRIAFYYMIATAVVVAVVFVIIHLIVKTTVYNNLDAALSYQAEKHTHEIFVEDDSIRFSNKAEWEEREHKEVEIHPVFLQINDRNGRIMDKSPNLKDQFLDFEHHPSFIDPHTTQLGGREIRQAQISLIRDGAIAGYILVAMPLEDTEMVLANLKNILLLLYPVVLFLLFFISRFLAGKSIIPIKQITETTNRITRSNLNERVLLPENKDELHTLSTSINDLLQRIQDAMEREKQFTSDASHELRTPLSVLKGTLEVLNRIPRSEKEYKEKIAFSIKEIDRMSGIVNQLLLLARLDKSSLTKTQPIQLISAIDEVLQRHKTAIKEKDLKVTLEDFSGEEVETDPYYLDLILDNLVGNAIKYSFPASSLLIQVKKEGHQLACSIQDQGIGIRQEDLQNIFMPFFRSEALNHKEIKGNGLGLSIVQKACNLIHSQLKVESQINSGTTVTLVF